MSTPNPSQQQPNRNAFSEAVLIEIFSSFMRTLNTLVGAQMPDKAVAVQHDLAQLKTQLDSGEVKDRFTAACKKILATHLGNPGYIAIYNEAKTMVDQQIAQQQAARKQQQQHPPNAPPPPAHQPMMFRPPPLPAPAQLPPARGLLESPGAADLRSIGLLRGTGDPVTTPRTDAPIPRAPNAPTNGEVRPSVGSEGHAAASMKRKRDDSNGDTSIRRDKHKHAKGAFDGRSYDKDRELLKTVHTAVGKLEVNMRERANAELADRLALEGQLKEALERSLEAEKQVAVLTERLREKDERLKEKDERLKEKDERLRENSERLAEAKERVKEAVGREEVEKARAIRAEKLVDELKDRARDRDRSREYVVKQEPMN